MKINMNKKDSLKFNDFSIAEITRLLKQSNDYFVNNRLPKIQYICSAESKIKNDKDLSNLKRKYLTNLKKLILECNKSLKEGE